MDTKTLLKHQAYFVTAPYLYPSVNYFFLIAGYASGKTSSLETAIMKAIHYFSGKKDVEAKLPKIIVAGVSITFLEKTLTGVLLQTIRGTKTPCVYNKQDNILRVAGVEIFFISMAEPEKIYGYNVCAVFVDELDELDTATSREAVKSLQDRARQQIRTKEGGIDERSAFLCFATTSQGTKGCYQTIQDFRKKGIRYIHIKARTKDNIYLPKDYVDNMYAIYNANERKCLLEGEFINIDSSLVFPSFNYKKNVLPFSMYASVEEDDLVIVGQDFNKGFNKAIALIIRGGDMIVIKEYSFPDIQNVAKTLRYDFPHNTIYWIPDATAREHFTNIQREFRMYNIQDKGRPTNPKVEDRVFVINKAFYTGRLKICEDCPDLIEAVSMHQRDAKRNNEPRKGKTEWDPDHLSDVLGYAVNYAVGWDYRMRDFYLVTRGRQDEKKALLGHQVENSSNYEAMMKEKDYVLT